MVLGIIGILSNILTIIVLQRINRKRNPVIRMVMILIALSDSLELFNYITTDCFDYIFPEFHSNQYQIFRRSNLIWIVPFQAMTMTFNRWLVLILTCNNWVVMRDAWNLKIADKTEESKRLKSVITTITILGVVSIVVNIPLIHQFKYTKCHSFMAEGIKAEVAPSACEPSYLWGYLTGFTLVTNTLLPATTQILMNAYIIKVLVGMKRRRAAGRVVITGKQDTADRIILMCSTVAIVYLALQTPYIVSTVEITRTTVITCKIRICENQLCKCYGTRGRNCSESMQSRDHNECYDKLGENTDEGGKSFDDRIRPYHNFGLILNCSINLFIYLLTSPNFRQELYYMLQLDRLHDLVSNTSTGETEGRRTGETQLPAW